MGAVLMPVLSLMTAASLRKFNSSMKPQLATLCEPAQFSKSLWSHYKCGARAACLPVVFYLRELEVRSTSRITIQPINSCLLLSVARKTETMTMMSKVALVAILALALAPLLSNAEDISHMKQLAAKHNRECILVFGDSSVDPGNNNRLPTSMKGNFAPYGKDFFNGRPTGRFSNGRLATDFIAEALGHVKQIPAFLDPNLKPVDLIRGVSFASAASGYDDLTANLSNVLTVSKQLEYFRHYKIHLRKLVGQKKAEDIVNNAAVILSMGTNDFLQNYYLEPDRPKQYTLQQYQNYLASNMFSAIKEMHRLGVRKLVVVGIPPLGCMPLVKTLMGESSCVEKFNEAASSFNAKLKAKLALLKTQLGLKNAFVDCYTLIQNAVQNPKEYGFVEVSKGCCGTGTIEYGSSCRGLSTCADASAYAFWDAVHPTEKMYRIIANEAINCLGEAPGTG